ncbi:heat shock protein class I [Halalkalibacter wakoensis JCM 9140]|uniref:Heat shock protein class I n=1 Tax=Halalkalibacter wakoensis JCM 9140 TaxID=1236970 RepID=W4PXK1_9BACI|nr:Hsp20/alpha crystallin family protein [Halalkalibacter wakoensis]GAE24447.1 heat shock protein class I [Halalkalibacter wakoensis JCM 9140]
MSKEQQPWSNKLPQPYQNVLKSIDSFFQNTMQNIHDNPLFLAPIPTNVYETNDSFIIEAELPGVSKKQIGLDVYRHAVRIQVTQDERTEYIDDESGITERVGHRQVRQRVIPVPFFIEEHEVKATYKNGLLQIIIPNKRKQIPIE